MPLIEFVKTEFCKGRFYAGMFVGDMALSYALGKMAFYEAGAVAPLTQEELQLAEYANDVASMASEYGGISITAGGELVIDPVAETFLTGYTSNITPEEYQIAFDFFRGEGNACERRRGRIQRARVGAAVGDGQAACPPQTEPGTARGIGGMDFETAAAYVDDVGIGMSRESAFAAHSLGVNEATLTGSAVSDTIGNGSSSEKLLWDSWKNYEKVEANGQLYAKVGDRLYSKHAVNRMQPSGNRFGINIYQNEWNYGRSIAPQYIEDIIRSTEPVYQPKTGNWSYTSGSVEIIINDQGYVVTIMTYKK